MFKSKLTAIIAVTSLAIARLGATALGQAASILRMLKHMHLLTITQRRLTSLSLVAALPIALLVAPGAASAATFAVSPGDAASLQSALAQAAAHPNVGGPDVVSIPAGTYVGSFTYNGDAVDVEGAGSDTTKLTTATGTATLSLKSSAGTVGGVSIENTQSGPVGYGLSLPQGGTVRNVELDATGNNVYGLFPSGDTTVSDARMIVHGNDTGMRTPTASTITISRTTIQGSGADSIGIEADSQGATVHVDRLDSTGVQRPLVATFGASLTARDSLLILPKGIQATGLWVGDDNNPADFTSKLVADRVTIVGDPAASQRGAYTYADSAGDDFQLSIHDSVVVGIQTPFYCWTTAGHASATADWSSLPQGDSSGGGCTVARTNPVAGTPIFVDAASGDYHQRYDSPLIDAGDPAPLTASDDLDGLTRPVGRVDLGAYEYQRRAPSVNVSVTPASASPGQAVTFVATASDPDPGDSPLTYSWSFDDGATATGPSATHAFATSGPHTATVTVTDPTGQSATATGTVTSPTPSAPTPSPTTSTPTTPPSTSPTPAFAGVKLVSTRLTFALGFITLRLSCPAGTVGRCSGKTKLTARHRSTSSTAASTVTLGYARFSIAAGKQATVMVRVWHAGRRLLARAPRLRARDTNAAHDGAGQTKTTESAVTVRHPQP